MKEFPKRATTGELYTPAMSITDPEEATDYFEALVNWHVEEWDKPRDEAIQIVKSNLGYWAGYFSPETRERVEELFDCAHPVFGKAKDGTPSFETALETGKALARGGETPK